MAAERILIAEDNEKNIKLFRDVLQLSGYETLEASTGEQAIELAIRHTPDLVLMDIRLPGPDGLEALRRLREDERTADIPVVALTAQAMAGDRERFLEAGFNGYVSKPVNIVEFISTVRHYCAERGHGEQQRTRDLVVDDTRGEGTCT
jgi:CheY-like chemotaxis protein